LITKASHRRCALIIIADGFEETETIIWLSTLRQAGLCIKSVGLTSGLVSGAHGIWLRPDLGFADLDHWLKTTGLSPIILPDGEQSLARLEADPRVHELLRQVVKQRGQIITGSEGLRLVRIAVEGDTKAGGPKDSFPEIVLLRDSTEAWESFAQNLVQRHRRPRIGIERSEQRGIKRN
jgi:hypothetical protein